MTEISLEMLVALGYLPSREREVVIDRVVRGESLRTIGARLGLSRTRVQQIERRGLSMLQDALEAVDFVR